MNKKSMGKIHDFINKDVIAENENKRVIVTLRILYIFEFIAFVLDVILAGTDVIRTFPYRLGALFFANIFLFFLTYRSKTKPALLEFMVFTFAWILFMIPCVGWSAGMQNYFILILMLCFFAQFGRKLYKFLNAGFVLMVRILTIWIFGGTKPVVEIVPIQDKCLQITNISAVFVSIIFISYMFSQKENEAEDKLMKYNDKLKHEASTDQLTGLKNRRSALEFVQSLNIGDMSKGISLAMCDIDFFKKVNDTYGHDAGDEVLKFVANMMIENCDDTALVSRWGGEEFLIVFPDCNGDQAFVVLEKLRKTLKNSVIKVDEADIKITMTFGLAEYSFNGDIDSAIKEADEKLYMGKQNGRNQVVY